MVICKQTTTESRVLLRGKGSLDKKSPFDGTITTTLVRYIFLSGVNGSSTARKVIDYSSMKYSGMCLEQPHCFYLSFMVSFHTKSRT